MKLDGMTWKEKGGVAMPALTIEELRSRPTLSVQEFWEAIGIGRTVAYRSISQGEVPVIRWGRTIRVPTPYVLGLLGIGIDGRPLVEHLHDLSDDEDEEGDA
jgi:hypothetical protein